MTTEITNTDISALRAEAAAAGDHCQALMCDRALGEVTSDEGLDHLRIWAFLDGSAKRLHRSLRDDQCREYCERAILDGRA